MTLKQPLQKGAGNVQDFVCMTIEARDGGEDGLRVTVPQAPSRCSTHRDLLKAVSTIRRFIEDLNAPFLKRWKDF